MPITDMYFRDGIFFAREHGRIEKADARMWARQLNFYASHSPVPIVAFVDALDVAYISNDARKIFVRASHTPNLKLSVVAASHVISAQTARIIGLMAEENHTHIFRTLGEAYAFAIANTSRPALT